MPPLTDGPVQNPFQGPGKAPSSAVRETDACDCSTCDILSAAPQGGEKVARRSLDKTRHARFDTTQDPVSPSSASDASGHNLQQQQQQQLDTGQAAESCKDCGKEQQRGRRSAFAGSTCEACSWQGHHDLHPILRGVAASSMSESEFKLRLRQTGSPQPFQPNSRSKSSSMSESEFKVRVRQPGPQQLPQSLDISKSSSISSEQAEVLRQTWSGLTHYSLECPDDAGYEVRRAPA